MLQKVIVFAFGAALFDVGVDRRDLVEGLQPALVFLDDRLQVAPLRVALLALLVERFVTTKIESQKIMVSASETVPSSHLEQGILRGGSTTEI